MIIDINMDSYEYLQSLCMGDAYKYIEELEYMQELEDEL